MHTKWLPTHFRSSANRKWKVSLPTVGMFTIHTKVWNANAFNTLRPKQNGRHFPHNIFKCIFLNDDVWISKTILLKFVPKGPINNIPALVQIMAWRLPGDKPLSEPMMVSSLMHICIAQPQWVNSLRLSDTHMHGQTRPSMGQINVIYKVPSYQKIHKLITESPKSWETWGARTSAITKRWPNSAHMYMGLALKGLNTNTADIFHFCPLCVNKPIYQLHIWNSLNYNFYNLDIFLPTIKTFDLFSPYQQKS